MLVAVAGGGGERALGRRRGSGRFRGDVGPLGVVREGASSRAGGTHMRAGRSAPVYRLMARMLHW